MSTVSYGDLRMSLVRTLEFRAEPEKDPSGSDLLWTKFILRVRATIYPDTFGIAANGPSNLADIRYHLEQPRQNLVYNVAGTDLLNITAPDAQYGPEPLPASVQQMNEGPIFVDWGVIARVASCPDRTLSESPLDPSVVSLRWDLTETHDENWFSTLRTSGLLIVRTDLRQSADSFRALCVPQIAANFQRTTAEYTLNSTGTQLRFMFVDKENYISPPAPATKASGHFIVSSTQPGAKRLAQCTVRLEGPPGVARFDLMKKAWQVALSKMESARPQSDEDTGVPIYGGSFHEDLYRNQVEVSVNATLAAFSKSAAKTINKTTFGTTPYSAAFAPGIAPPVRARLAGLFAAAFRDPCAAQAALATNDQGGRSVIPVVPRAIIRQSVERELNSTTAFDGADDTGGYDWYQIRSRYIWDEGRCQLPGTGVGNTPRASKIVTVSGGAMRLVVYWTARRRGKAPVLPAYKSTDPNLKEMGGEIIPEEPNWEGTSGESPTYTVTGEYHYACVDPDKVNVLSATPPFLSPLAASAAKETTRVLSTNMLFRFTGETASNPFAPGTTTDGATGNVDTPGTQSLSTRNGYTPQQKPDTSLPQQVAGSTSDLPPLDPAFPPVTPDPGRPFDLASGLGGNLGPTPGGDGFFGGGQLPNVGPPVNP